MQGYYPVSISLNAFLLIKIDFSLNEGDLIIVQMNK